MQARVTAILVAHNGSEYLDRTLAALSRQVRSPDSIVVVDAGSSDSSASQLADAHPTLFVTARGRGAFGDGISQGERALQPLDSEEEWLWLLGHDNAPEPRALAELLGAVEIAPSVAVAGPKLMRWDAPDTISSYGSSLSKTGASIELVRDELDQAQHDRRSDILAVAAGGMLVRRSVWQTMRGFDPALPHVDAALDFCVRVRLAGHRIVCVPPARVASSGPPETFGRKVIHAGARARFARQAQLHRRLAYAPAAAVPFHWLSLVPLAFVRAVTQLLAKNPGAVAGEFAAAFRAAFDPGVARARRVIRSGRSLGWAAIAPLRLPRREVRELNASRRETRAFADNPEPPRMRASFLSGGGGWITLALAAIGLLVFAPFVGAMALSGGALLPLSATAGELWSNAAIGVRDVGAHLTAAPDPFAWILAVLGSLTFWSPSLSIVLLYFAALPLAGLGAWWATTRIAERAWAPAVAAIAWALAPPFLAALGEGRVGAVVAHILLPWLALALLGSARSWSAAAAAALLFAGVSASAPILIPALLLVWIAWMSRHPSSVFRTIIVAIPALAIFAPLIVQQLARANPLALLADPGLAVDYPTASGWQLVLGSPESSAAGWQSVVAALGWSGVAAPIIAAALLVPLAALAMLALFLPGWSRSIPAMVLALVGFATAVASTHLQVSFDGATPVPIWAGAGLSLMWLGLIAAAACSLELLGRAVATPALLAVVTIAALAWPLASATLVGSAAVHPSSGRLLPALVTADARAHPQLATLELTAQADGGLAASVHRGAGTTLDDLSTLASTAVTPSAQSEQLAVLAGNLASASAFDPTEALAELNVGFVLAPEVSGDAARATRERVIQALDANPTFTPINSATAFGYLWKYEGDVPATARPSNPFGSAVLAAQATLLVAFLLLAVPAPGRRRSSTATHADDDELTQEFDEDDDE